MAGQIFGRKCHFVRIFVLQSLQHISNAEKETAFVQCGQAFVIICTSYHALYTRKNSSFCSKFSTAFEPNRYALHQVSYE